MIALPKLDAALAAIGESLAAHEWATVAALDAVLQDARIGNPLPVMMDAAEDASWWSSYAAPIELEAYLGAIVRVLPETPLHIKSRKRIMAAMWRAMPAPDKKAFLEWAAQNDN
jgi:hypothetical protein